MIVCDTNVVACLLIACDKTEDCVALIRNDSEWHAPVFWETEFRSVLGQYVRADKMDWQEAESYFQQGQRRLQKRTHILEASEVFALMAAQPVSAYDAEFVALAKRFRVKLATYDRKLLKMFPEVAMTPGQILTAS
jgi:predicted nucleic acid-binding protein